MDEKDIKKLNTIFEFLNELGRQITQKVSGENKENIKGLVRDLYELSEGLKKTLSEELKKNKFEVPVVDLPDGGQEVQMPLKVNFPSFPDFPKDIKVSNFPKFPDFPKFPAEISVKEAADITAILNEIVVEVREKNLGIDLSKVERGLFNLQVKFGIEIDKLKRSVPTIYEIWKLPQTLIRFLNRFVEGDRFKVILPKDQVMPKTPLGEKIKGITGRFMGGRSPNTSVNIKNVASQVINPATEESVKSGGASGSHSEVGEGTTTVTAAGTAVPLSSTSVPCKRVWVGAHESNSGVIAVGGAGVVAALATREGTPLYPTQGDWFNVSNLNLLSVDSTQNGDKVNYFYEN
jgi:hypothetical protein